MWGSSRAFQLSKKSQQQPKTGRRLAGNPKWDPLQGPDSHITDWSTSKGPFGLWGRHQWRGRPTNQLGPHPFPGGGDRGLISSKVGTASGGGVANWFSRLAFPVCGSRLQVGGVVERKGSIMESFEGGLKDCKGRKLKVKKSAPPPARWRREGSGLARVENRASIVFPNKYRQKYTPREASRDLVKPIRRGKHGSSPRPQSS